jgi:hypothetical protein
MTTTTSQRNAPVVRIVSGHASVPGGALGARDSRNRPGAHNDLHAPIVMSLLAASTTLALYDLYVLISTLATTG